MAKNDIINTLVTKTTNNHEVGYGSVGADVLGVVTAIESRGNGAYELGFNMTYTSGTFLLSSATATSLGLEGEWVVTVNYGGVYDKVKMTQTASKKCSAGQYAIVGTNGVVEKLDTATSTATKNALVIAVNDDGTVVIKIS